MEFADNFIVILPDLVFLFIVVTAKGTRIAPYSFCCPSHSKLPFVLAALLFHWRAES
jgi:hypothetical protein